jgi:hypothetical protein
MLAESSCKVTADAVTQEAPLVPLADEAAAHAALAPPFTKGDVPALPPPPPPEAARAAIAIAVRRLNNLFMRTR